MPDTVAFIGLGAMGAPMASNLLAAGFALRVFNRRAERARPFAELGATVCASVAEAVQGARFVVSIVSDDDATRAVMLAEGGVVASAAPATIVVDSSTNTPAMAREVAQAAAARGLAYLDAPVSGSVPQSRNRELVFMAGGDAAAFDAVRPLLDACDRSSPVGRRDFAVITMLHRLGLRCAELVELRLQDVDWQAGTLTVRGKGDRIDLLPLPIDVGQALVEYLRHARPRTTARTVFVRAAAPFPPLASSSASCIVARTARRAGLGTVHADRLRHTAASRTLNAGASLQEVAHLLRHASPATTTI